MIYEFAVDPGAVNSWQRFRYIYDFCGIEMGRIISEFPKEWEKKVIESCNDSEINRKRIVERLIMANNTLMYFGRDFNPSFTWIKNADQQHIQKPFRAIISLENPSNNPYVIHPDEDLSKNELWLIERSAVVPRQAEKLSECAELLLSRSKQILIIEPNFDPNQRRFRNTFSWFMNFANKGEAPVRIELHVKDHKENTEWWRKTYREKLSPFVHAGYVLKIRKWKNMEAGEGIHPRYVMTELGGIQYDYGIDWTFAFFSHQQPCFLISAVQN